MTMRGKWIALLLGLGGPAAALVLGALSGCTGGTGPGGQETAAVLRRDFSSRVLATGVVRARVGAEVRVGARISGKVLRLHANIGDTVTRNQIIAELEKEDLEAVLSQRKSGLAEAQAKLAAELRVGPLAVSSAEAAVTAAEAEVEAARAALSTVQREGPLGIRAAEAEVEKWKTNARLAKRDLERQEDLLKKDFTSEKARDLAADRLASASAQEAMAGQRLSMARVRLEEDGKRSRAQVDKAQAGLELSRRALSLARAGHEERRKELSAAVDRNKAAVTNAEVNLSFATIRAPISGVIGAVSTQEGETVAAGLSAPTFVTIIDLGRLQVDAFVDEVDIGKIKTGQKAVFTVDAYPSLEFSGKVSAIYPKAVIQENVVYYDVVVDIDPYAAGCTLRPDMTASVTLVLEKREGVLAVPAGVLSRREGKTVVTVAADGEQTEVEVRTGWRDGEWIEVLQGLTEGQTVLFPPPLETEDDED
jgi:RND family efflux transporter MFP subunit